MRIPRRVVDYLGTQKRSVIVTAGLVCVAVLAVIDFATGFEISFALFYVFPISFVAWYAGLKSAVVLSVASAAVWEEANRLAGQTYSSPAIPVWNAITRLGFFVTISVLLEFLKQALMREQALSRTDSLTGIHNRRAFQEEAQVELARARRTERPLTVIYIDLDNFKSINDRLGHETGDRLLCVVARTLRKNLRVTDTVARLGGDEFGVLLPETSDGVAKTLIAKNHQTLVEEMHQNNWPVGFSVGVLTCRVAPETVDAMMRLADELMYSVKADSKNAIRFSVYGN